MLKIIVSQNPEFLKNMPIAEIVDRLPVHPVNLVTRVAALVKNNTSFGTTSKVAIEVIKKMIRNKLIACNQLAIHYLSKTGELTIVSFDVEGNLFPLWPEEGCESIMEIDFYLCYN